MNKIWQKNTASLQEVETFTVGLDRDLDVLLAPYDVLGSIAHVRMLGSVGLLETAETEALISRLREIYALVRDPAFSLEAGVEDIHSQVELLLTRMLGDAGKKIHSARSRNDQVLLDLKLFLRAELEALILEIQPFFELLQEQSEAYKDYLFPGYTHLQLAMPSSFGLWFGAYSESLVDDCIQLRAAYAVVNKNPLGSAAGYGSSFPIDRTLTTRLLGFDDLNYNVVYAQMGRGKTERVVAMALAGVAETLGRLAMDACMYLNQQFDFISFPPELTTGSSIMPHKKNPDVFELIRAHCNRIKALPGEIMMMTTNLPSGYHRDLQLLKEHLFPAFANLRDCLRMAQLMIRNVSIKKDILKEEKYKYLFSVEVVNRLVAQGVPFRDAYRQVGLDIESGRFSFEGEIHHTHEGSIGNLCNASIRSMMVDTLHSFPFARVRAAENALLGKG